MTEKGIPRGILNARPEDKHRLGRTRARWTDNLIKYAKWTGIRS